MSGRTGQQTARSSRHGFAKLAGQKGGEVDDALMEEALALVYASSTRTRR